MLRAICTLVAVLLLSAAARGADSLWQASSGLLPNEIPHAYTFVDQADPEDPVLAGGVLTLATSEDAERMFYIQSGADLDVPDPWVIEFEMRQVSGASSIVQREPTLVFLTTKADEGQLMSIGADTIFMLTNASTVGPTASVDTDDAFHRYRLEAFGDGSLDLYQDDALVLEGATYVDAGDHGPVPRIAFGPASQGSFGVSEWKSFGHNGRSILCGDGIQEGAEACDDGNTATGDGCDAACAIEPVCTTTPPAPCRTAAKASLSIVEKAPGSEKLKAKLQGFDAATSQADFGDPVGGATRYDVCLYDAQDQVVAELNVSRGGVSCGAKPCWKAKGTSGFGYKDPAASADGVQKIAAAGGAAGKGKLQLQAGNKAKKGQTALPAGLTAALASATSARLQVRTSDAACFEAALGTVTKSDATLFKAKAP